MTGWFAFTGFGDDDRLVAERCLRCEEAAVHAAIGPAAADDPGLVHCYPLDRAAVARLSGDRTVPAAAWFVSAVQGPLAG